MRKSSIPTIDHSLLKQFLQVSQFHFAARGVEQLREKRVRSEMIDVDSQRPQQQIELFGPDGI